MPEQSDFVNYYLQSLQDNLAHMIKEKALDEAKLNFKDAEMGELKKINENLNEQIQSLSSTISNLEKQTRSLEENTSKVNEYENRNKELEHKLQEAQNRCATLTAKVDQAHRDLTERDAEIEALKEEKKPKRRRKKVVDTT